jgi:hypothetical protein
MEKNHMAKFTVEVTFYLPVYTHVTVEAENPEAAAHAAKEHIENNGWDSQKHDYDCSSSEYVTGIWQGEEAYGGKSRLIPKALRAPKLPW